jgi:Tfp pilus assembly protein PilF
MDEAMVLSNEGRDEDAARKVDQAIKLEPKNTDYLTTRGGMFYLQKRYEEAERVLDQALSIDPSFREARILKCMVVYRRGLSSEEERKRCLRVASGRSINE